MVRNKFAYQSDNIKLCLNLAEKSFVTNSLDIFGRSVIQVKFANKAVKPFKYCYIFILTSLLKT